MDFELVLTRNCNLNCKYCFEGKKTNELMSTKLQKDIIEFIENYREQAYVYNHDYVRVDFNGGEPLLNSQFIYSFINLCNSLKKDYVYSLTTNGILLDKKMISFIKRESIHLQISLDGNKETHDKNRLFYNEEGSYEIVIDKLNKLKENELNHLVIISLVFTPETVKNLYSNIQFILEMGFYDISISICSDSIWTEYDMVTLKQQAKLIGELYIEYYNKGIGITISALSNYIENTLLNFAKPICGAVSDYIAILPNGDLLPCGGFVGCKNEKDMIIGNISKNISSGEIDFYLNKDNVDALETNKECSKCKLLSRCQHNCFAINNRINNDRTKVSISGCIVNKIFIMESDQVLSKLLSTKNTCFIKKYKSVLGNIRE